MPDISDDALGVLVRIHLKAVAAAGLAVALGPLAVPAAQAAGDDRTAKGAFSTPFREDGATYTPQTAGTPGGVMASSERDDTGCKAAPEPDGHIDCLPAGATQNVLADGRVLYWNAIEGAEDIKNGAVPDGGWVARNDQSRVLSLNYASPADSSWTTPANADGYFAGTPRETPLPLQQENPIVPNDGSLFCSNQVQLSDGTILTTGGTNYYEEPGVPGTSYGVIELEGIRNARIFDPAADGGQGGWKPTGSMNYGRWYPAMVTQPDGNVFVASGVTKLIKPVYSDHPQDSGTNVKQTETYNVAAGTWGYNGASADKSLPLFPRLHLLPNGNVYYGASGQAFNPFGQSYDEALWNMASSYNTTTKAWTDLGLPGIGTATPGFRGSTFQQMLPLAPPYDSASFLTAGGVTGLPSPGSYLPTDESRIDTVDVAGGTETLSTKETGPLGRARWYSAGVTLPTGQVLAFSGADTDEVWGPGQEHPIRQDEIFTPDGNGGGTWSDVAVQNRRRTYHNNAVLLPTGQVLVGGHAPIPNGYGKVMNNPNLPVGPEASNNFKDASFEIYSPPYLFHGDRPAIANANPQVNYGSDLSVTLDTATDPSSITKVVLVRNPAETHLVDGDQRVVELPITARNGQVLTAAVTANRAVLPPGPYMLFVIKGGTAANGNVDVPSVATQVFVGAPVPAWATNHILPSAVPPVQHGAANAIGKGHTAPPVVASGHPARPTGVALAAAAAVERRDASSPSTRELPWMLAVTGGVVTTGAVLTRKRRRRAAA